MNYNHYPTSEFLNKASEIKKIYPSFGDDLKKMRRDINSLSSLKGQPHIDDLGGGLFKYRLKISDKPASKSYGARIIFVALNDDDELWYLTCYDKSDAGDLSPAQVKAVKKLVGDIKGTSPREKRLSIFGDKMLKPKLRKAKRKGRN